MAILTPFQQQLLRAIGQTQIAENFYLTGGTALAAYFLQHRLSEDLDFFSSDPNAVRLVKAPLQAVAAKMDATLEFSRTFNTFVECFITGPNDERVKFDFAQDSPFRLLPTTLDPEFGLQIDSALDIASNKLAALFGRAAEKDFVDVFFIHQELLPFHDLLIQARKKHVGMDDYWLAISLRRVQEVKILPRMIKSLDLTTLRAFFLGLADDLMGSMSDLWA
jgi:predicted nucleotidyltransferase component of viral defense system